jgi:hypothetical protein
VTLDPKGTTKSFIEIREVNQAADGRVMDIPSNMPFGTSGIKLIDWIKGIQKKFNLIIYPDRNNTNSLIVETFNNWYNKGDFKDFNKYINLNSKIEVISANNLAVNKLNFGDALDTDYISQQFAKAANREYGQAYYVDNNNFFSQGEFLVKTTFASDPLVYLPGTGLSGSVSGINPTPTAFLAGNVKLTSNSNPIYVCSSPISINVYTLDGTFTPGQILFYDQYATSPVTGFRWFSKGPGISTTAVNSTTGIIGSDTFYSC